MAKKQLSFAEKAAKKKGKSDVKYVKYVNSLKSEKTGQWRFNERMIGLHGGESLDAALKRIEEEKKLLHIELPDPVSKDQEETSETASDSEVTEPKNQASEESIETQSSDSSAEGEKTPENKIGDDAVSEKENSEEIGQEKNQKE
jgi:hypothetical protein